MPREEAVKPRKFVGVSLKAIIEVTIYYIAIIATAYLFGDSHRWISVCPHPFWVAVLYAGLAYGPAEGILAALLATIFLYAGNLPPQGLDEPPTDYHLRLFLPFFLWVAAGGLVGEVRSRTQERIHLLEEERNHLLAHLEQVQQQQTEIKQQSSLTQQQLNEQRESLCQIYAALRDLSMLKPAQIITQLDNLVVAALKPQKFSVFACGSSGLEATICFGWQDDDVYLRRFVTSNPLYKQVVNTMRIVYRDSPLDKSVLLNEGVLAGPLIDVYTSQVFGMLKIERLELPLSSSELLEQFKLICDLISALYSQARLLQLDEKMMMYASKSLEDQLLSFPLYRLQSEFLIHLCRHLSIPLCAIQFSLSEKNYISADLQQYLRLKQLQPTIHDLFPPFIQLFAGSHRGEYCLLLPNYTVAQAEEMEMMLRQRLESLSSSLSVNTKIVSLNNSI